VVGGSNPSWGATYRIKDSYVAAEFDSALAEVVAQLAEQQLVELRVGGSSPLGLPNVSATYPPYLALPEKGEDVFPRDRGRAWAGIYLNLALA
jgi:hypothetical protein